MGLAIVFIHLSSVNCIKTFTTTAFVPQKNETAMVLAVLKTPLVVYVDASLASFQMYHSGVYSDPSCGATIDHTMQLVGYGTLQGQPYWILKNSWGRQLDVA